MSIKQKLNRMTETRAANLRRVKEWSDQNDANRNKGGNPRRTDQPLPRQTPKNRA